MDVSELKTPNFRLFALLLIISVLSGLVYVSAVSQGVMWQKSYDVSAAKSVQPTIDGGYVISGGSVYLIKISSSGTIQWQQSYSGGQDDWSLREGSSVRQTSDGGYIISLINTSPDVESNLPNLIKIKSDGSIQWSKNYGYYSGYSFSSVRQCADGGFIVVGTSYDGTSSSPGAILKTDSEGRVSWRVGGLSEGDWRLTCVELTEDGGYIIGGDNTYSPHLLKLSASGSVVWDHEFLSGSSGRVNSVAVSGDGSFIVVGYVEDVLDSGNMYPGYVAKIDGNGILVWFRLLEEMATTNLGGGVIGLTVACNENIIICGGIGKEAGVIELDARGNTLWTRTYGGGVFSSVFSVSGGYVLAGEANGQERIIMIH